MQRLPFPQSFLPREAMRFTLPTTVLPMGQMASVAVSQANQAGQKPVGLIDVPNLGVARGPKQVNPADLATLGGRLIPLYPNVRLKPLPFYDVIGEIQKPTTLLARVKTYFKFNLTPKQAQDIAMSREVHPDHKMDYRVQVQLRFCYIDPTCEQGDKLPPQLIVTVNGTHAQLPDFLPCRRGAEPKRPDLPIDITPLCRMSATMTNHIEISWGFETGKAYCVTVKLVKKLTSDILLHRLNLFGNRNASHTRAFIKEKLKPDMDSEIATTSLRVSLICPLGKMRMKIPCRSSVCTHLQCFDAKTFLMMNEKKARWMCPVCDKPTRFLDLYIDGYFHEILSCCTEADEVEFSSDGSWRYIKEEENVNAKENQSPSVSGKDISAGDKPNEELPVIDLISDDEDSLPPPCEKSQPAEHLSPPGQTNTVASKPDASVIDFSRLSEDLTQLIGNMSTLADSLSQSTDNISQPVSDTSQHSETQTAVLPHTAGTDSSLNSENSGSSASLSSRPSSNSSRCYNSEIDGIYTTGEDIIRSSNSNSSAGGSQHRRLSSSTDNSSVDSGSVKSSENAKTKRKTRSGHLNSLEDSSSNSSINFSQIKRVNNRKLSSDSDSSPNFKKLRRRRSKPNESDAEAKKNQRTALSKSKHKRVSKDSIGSTGEVNGESDSDTDIYIPINNRNRSNVIESDENSGDPPEISRNREKNVENPALLRDTDLHDKNTSSGKFSNLNKDPSSDSRRTSVSSGKLGKLKPVVKVIDITKCKKYQDILKTKSIKLNSVQPGISKTARDTKLICDKNTPVTIGRNEEHIPDFEREPETEGFNDLSETVEYGTDSSEDFLINFSDESSTSSSGSDWEIDSGRKKISKRKMKTKGQKKKRSKSTKAITKFREARELWLKKKAKSLKLDGQK